MIELERIHALNRREITDGSYVLYWMQQSQRARNNPALELAIHKANALQTGLVVGFGLTADYPHANTRHVRFMLEGLSDVQDDLSDRGIPLCVRLGTPDDVALELAKDARLVVCDRGELRHQREWRSRVGDEAPCQVIEVESDSVVPLTVVSDKAEFAARTLRPRVHEHLERFLTQRKPIALNQDSRSIDPGGVDLSDVGAVLRKLDLDESVPGVPHFFRGGTREALRRMRRFRDERLKNYSNSRSDPATGAVSRLSPYLHFGQISPVEVAMELGHGRYGKPEDREAYVEELVVRRTLAQNFVRFTEKYDSYSALPVWARDTLGSHKSDDRPHHYTKRQLETAQTHDPYWNAAMREMRYTGYMHNHLRMYWGKKILEWTNSPAHAYRVLLELNNRYFLDGRDPNSYANVSWIFGLHDRPWPEREVFGKVRSMTASGLERKIDIDAYVTDVDRRVAEAKEAGVVFEDD